MLISSGLCGVWNSKMQVFQFADKYRGSYSNGLRPWVCPFYCSFSGYQVISKPPEIFILIL